MKPKNPAEVKAAAIAKGALESNGPIAIPPKVQTTLDGIAQAHLTAQHAAQQAQIRLSEAFELLLVPMGLDPTQHRWAWDGEHISIHKIEA